MAMRVNEPLVFAEAMLESHLREYHAMKTHPGHVIFDRGLPDVVGFLDVSGLPVSQAIDQACREIRYDGPILRAPPWQAIYRQDNERIQDWEGAVASDAAVAAAWRRYGYRVQDLPLASVKQRLAALLTALAD